MRATVPALEEILYQPFPVLDRGFVRVVDYMGDDSAIVQAARVSYGRGTKKITEDRGLIHYLMRHRHSTPFEMCEIKFHVKLPIFVARQWIRHRTANVNEYSARYSILEKEFYVPDAAFLKSAKAAEPKKKKTSQAELFGSPESTANTLGSNLSGVLGSVIKELREPKAVAAQSATNKQGRGDMLSDAEVAKVTDSIEKHSLRSYSQYLGLLNQNENGSVKDDEQVGVARELARTVLPVNYYTQWYWKIDLHNLFHFLSLRADEHAQYEIREYASEMLNIARKWVPIACEAFEQHRLHAVTLSAAAMAAVKRMLAGETVTAENSGLGKREWAELQAELARKGG
ncbi:MAG: FAD-dependent thymidylate synthase [Thermomicrobiales bacterium]